MFYKCYFSVMPEDITMKIILYSKSQIFFWNLFYFSSFWKNGVEWGYKYENTKNRQIQTSLTPQCASHCRVELLGVHPTAKSSSAVCITQQSQVIKISQKALGCACLFIRGPDRFESWKKWRLKILWLTPFYRQHILTERTFLIEIRYY